MSRRHQVAQVNRSLFLARRLALLIPAVLLAGAWGFQLIRHLAPCEMCHWQRWPHYAALVIALISFAMPIRQSRPLVLLAALCILASGAIGVFHAGVEYHWWQGPARCASTLGGGSSADILRSIMAAQPISCDQPQWTLFGVSLAGFNAVLSLLGGFAVLRLCLRRR